MEDPVPPDRCFCSGSSWLPSFVAGGSEIAGRKPQS